MSKRKYAITLFPIILLLPCIIIVSVVFGCNLKDDNSRVDSGLNDCVVNHMLESRPDILEHFKAQGMDTSRSNWNNIVIEWSKMDPAGYAEARGDGDTFCAPGYPPCCPNSKLRFSANLIVQYAQRLAANKYDSNGNLITVNNLWNNEYIRRCKQASPGFMPCMTAVSTIWNIAGVKEMDSKLNRLDDLWSWYWPFGAPQSYPWSRGDHFYAYIASYYPELLKGTDIFDQALCSEDGYRVKNDNDPSFINQKTIDIVNERLRVGDVLQYFGKYPPVQIAPYFKHSVIVVKTGLNSIAKIASFGWEASSEKEWTDMNFGSIEYDYTHVRVIHLPAYDNIPLKPNLVENPSFELDSQGWSGNPSIQYGDYWRKEPGVPVAHYGQKYLSHDSKELSKTYQNIELQKGTYALRAYAYGKEYSFSNYICLANARIGIPYSNYQTNPWKCVMQENIKIDYSGIYELSIITSSPCHIDDVQLIKVQ